MKRNIKNIIMIIFIILVGFCSYFTMQDVKGNQVPEMPIGDFENGNMEELPEKPDEDNRSQMGTPPTKSGGENDNNQFSDNSKDEKGNGQTPPEMPNGDMREDKPNNMNRGNNQNSQIKTIHYIMFGMESFIVSILVIYLIMSKFNKLNLKETLSSLSKIMTYMLSTVIMITILIVIQNYITNTIFINKNSNNQNPKQLMQEQL